MGPWCSMGKYGAQEAGRHYEFHFAGECMDPRVRDIIEAPSCQMGQEVIFQSSLRWTAMPIRRGDLQ